MPRSETPELQLTDVWKTFGETHALKGVSLDVRGGEIHGLIGHNGSGKSTLVKLLSGVHESDRGTILLGGEPLRRGASRHEPGKPGMAFVHQDLAVVPGESILDNVRVGRYRRRWPGGPVDWPGERAHTRAALERFGLECDVDAPLASLRESERALLAIARAADQLAQSSEGVLVLDEPTVFLDRVSVERLFGAMRIARDMGRGVLFVSHKLEEVLAICDRVSILREGELIASRATAGLSQDELIELMLGRSAASIVPSRGRDVQETRALLRVSGLTGGGIQDLSFSVHPHEVVGLTGLVGAGFEDIPYLLYGSMPSVAGEASLGDREIDLPSLSPRRAIKEGIVLVPADRAGAGVFGQARVRENVTLPVLDAFFRLGAFQHRAERARARELVSEYGVLPQDSAESPIGSLSGGNQQKAALGKWLQTRPRVALLHEPTQGVDLGARADIFALLRKLADDGCAVVAISQDEDVLAQICDRVIVFHSGRVAAELSREWVDAETIAGACYQAASAETGDAGALPRVMGEA
jgi:ribose transport system ATP-binding protein